MMGNERPCDLGVLFDSAILAYTLLKVEFFIRPVYSPKHNKLATRIAIVVYYDATTITSSVWSRSMASILQITVNAYTRGK